MGFKKWPKATEIRENGIKARKYGQKPVETGFLPLTKLAKRRKVNGGRFFQTPAWIQGFRAIGQGNPQWAGWKNPQDAIPAKILGKRNKN
ncbi:MAG: hypothetical protein WA869_25365 [Alloacidobacterium sp.]